MSKNKGMFINTCKYCDGTMSCQPYGADESVHCASCGAEWEPMRIWYDESEYMDDPDDDDYYDDTEEYCAVCCRCGKHETTTYLPSDDCHLCLSCDRDDFEAMPHDE